MTRFTLTAAAALVIGLTLGAQETPRGQQPPPASGGIKPEVPKPPATRQPPGRQPPPANPQPVERIGDNQFRIGNVRVNTVTKEVAVDGVVNEVVTLEFLAGTKGGFKNYESAIELDTNAINFNLGLILIGLDKANSVAPRQHLDRAIPKGDPVEIWVDYEDGGKKRRIRGEQLVYNQATQATLPEGRWVYTGSTFVGRGNAFLADLDGALIGFVHSPAPLIDLAATARGPYGANRLNPSLNLKPGMPVVLTVKALPRPGPGA